MILYIKYVSRQQTCLHVTLIGYERQINFMIVINLFDHLIRCESQMSMGMKILRLRAT